MYIFRLIVQYFEENYFSSSLNADYENLNFTGTVTTLLMIVGGVCLGILLASYVIIFEKRVVGRFVRSLLLRGAIDAKTALSLSDLGLERNGFIKRELSRASVSRKLVSIVDAKGNVRTYESELRDAFPEFSANLADERAAEGREEESAEPLLSPDQIIAETDTLGVEDTAPVPKTSPRTRRSSRAFRLRAIDFATERFFIPEDLTYRAEIRSRKEGSSPLVLLLTVVLVAAFFLLSLYMIPTFVNMLDVTIGNLRF